MTLPANITAAFTEVTLALMEWSDPPEPNLHRDITEYLRRCDIVASLETRIYKPFSPQDEVEPFNVQADWDERAG